MNLRIINVLRKLTRGKLTRKKRLFLKIYLFLFIINAAIVVGCIIFVIMLLASLE